MRDEVAVLVEKEGAARFSYLDGGDEILHGIEREIEARDACDLTVLAKRRAEAHDRLVIGLRQVDLRDHDFLRSCCILVPGASRRIEVR